MIRTTHAGAALTAALLAILALLLPRPPPAHAQSAGSCGAAGGAAGAIVLDGQFGDWAGQPCIPDPPADCQNSRADLVGFFFTTVQDSPIAYFMAQTAAGASQPLGLRLSIDTNNDGSYTSAADRIVTVRYQAVQNGAKVDIDLLDGRGEKVAEISRDADWGESRGEGGSRVEWGISLAQLGVKAGQPLRMYLESQGGNAGGGSPCDSTQEVQWSPADALGLGLLLAIVLGVAALAARLRARLT